jgi:hypothetical protein
VDRRFHVFHTGYEHFVGVALIVGRRPVASAASWKRWRRTGEASPSTPVSPRRFGANAASWKRGRRRSGTASPSTPASCPPPRHLDDRDGTGTKKEPDAMRAPHATCLCRHDTRCAR